MDTARRLFAAHQVDVPRSASQAGNLQLFEKLCCGAVANGNLQRSTYFERDVDPRDYQWASRNLQFDDRHDAGRRDRSRMRRLARLEVAGSLLLRLGMFIAVTYGRSIAGRRPALLFRLDTASALYRSPPDLICRRASDCRRAGDYRSSSDTNFMETGDSNRNIYSPISFPSICNRVGRRLKSCSQTHGTKCGADYATAEALVSPRLTGQAEPVATLVANSRRFIEVAVG